MSDFRTPAGFYFSYSVLILLWYWKDVLLCKSEILWLTTLEKSKSVFLIGVAVSRALAEQQLSHQRPPWKVPGTEERAGDGGGGGEGEREREKEHHHHPPAPKQKQIHFNNFLSQNTFSKNQHFPLKMDISLVTTLSGFIFVITLPVNLWATLNSLSFLQTNP